MKCPSMNSTPKIVMWESDYKVGCSNFKDRRLLCPCKPLILWAWVFVLFCFVLALVWPLSSNFAIRIFKFKMPMIPVFPNLNPSPSSLPIPSLWVVPVYQPQASSIMHRTWTGDSFPTCLNPLLLF